VAGLTLVRRHRARWLRERPCGLEPLPPLSWGLLSIVSLERVVVLVVVVSKCCERSLRLSTRGCVYRLSAPS